MLKNKKNIIILILTIIILILTVSIVLTLKPKKVDNSKHAKGDGVFWHPLALFKNIM